MDKKITAMIAVVIIIGVAIGGALAISQKGDSGDSISIVDGSGKTVTISSPLKNVAVINSNAPKTLIMMGLSDSISCYYYGGNTYNIKCEELQKTEKDRNLGTYYTPSVETLLKYDVEAVICPVSSMTLYSSVEKQCNEVGVKVIRLNCTGGSILDDMKKISKLFGEPASATTVLNKYEESYNAALDAIEKAISDNGGKKYTFLSAFTSREAIYNHTSDMSALLEHLFIDNVTSYTDLSTKGVTNLINDNTVEKITDEASRVGVVVLRSISSEDSLSSYKSIYDDMRTSIIPNSMTAYTQNRVFVLNSDLMSGLYAHIGLIILVKAVYGISVPGYEDIDKVMNDFQKEFYQSVIVDSEILVSQFGASYPDGTASIYYTEPPAA